MNPLTRSPNKIGMHVGMHDDMHAGMHDGMYTRTAAVAKDGAGQLELDIDNSFIKSGKQIPDKDTESCRASEPTTKPIVTPSSPRNAWGNSSYADLITQAIMSSSKKRMTLQEIYAWISDNIPYFMDKKDGPTTTGWKNSVRHTLSIRKRFVRVRNTEYGSLNYKSHWTIDPHEETRKRSRGRPSEGNPSMSFNNPRDPDTNDTRMSLMRSGMIYEMPKVQTPGSCCPYCEGHSSLSVALPYQHGLSYYSYRF